MSLITIGIPVFNAMPYLPESMESILRQSASDFDILVINDGSTDGSLEYLISVGDPRLRIINQENRGLTATLNRMLSEVATPWLARHDADDVAYPLRIARTLEFIRKYPGAGMFYSLAEYFPKDTVGQFRTTRGEPDEIRKLVLSGYLPTICHPSVTLNVEKALNVGGYRFDLHVEDIDLWWRLALCEDIRFIPEVLVGFRQNASSISSANLTTQAINTLYIQYLLISQLLKRKPLPYDQARFVLMHLFDDRKFDFKIHIRAFNIALGRHLYGTAMMELGRAWLASPSDFKRRVTDEFGKRRMISVGELPDKFLRFERFLWPAEGPSHIESIPEIEAVPKFL